MLTYKTLENTSSEDLHIAFTKSFATYSIPMKLNLEQFNTKLHNEGVDLAISGGAYHNNELVGLILHARGNWNGQSTAYNAGTGVIPAFRGKGVTRQLYNFLIPVLQEHGVESCLLEVMQDNVPALTIYKSAGYEIKRPLDCYKLKTAAKLKSIKAPDFSIIPTKLTDDVKQHLYSWHNWAPTWQNSWDAMLRNKNLVAFMATLNGKPAGYITLDTKTGRVPQFALNPALRGQGIGNALFHRAYNELGQDHTISIINVDSSDSSTRSFLLKSGFEKYASQYEMEMDIESLELSSGNNTEESLLDQLI